MLSNTPEGQERCDDNKYRELAKLLFTYLENPLPEDMDVRRGRRFQLIFGPYVVEISAFVDPRSGAFNQVDVFAFGTPPAKDFGVEFDSNGLLQNKGRRVRHLEYLTMDMADQIISAVTEKINRLKKSQEPPSELHPEVDQIRSGSGSSFESALTRVPAVVVPVVRAPDRIEKIDLLGHVSDPAFRAIAEELIAAGLSLEAHHKESKGFIPEYLTFKIEGYDERVARRRDYSYPSIPVLRLYDDRSASENDDSVILRHRPVYINLWNWSGPNWQRKEGLSPYTINISGDISSSELKGIVEKTGKYILGEGNNRDGYSLELVGAPEQGDESIRNTLINNLLYVDVKDLLPEDRRLRIDGALTRVRTGRITDNERKYSSTLNQMLRDDKQEKVNGVAEELHAEFIKLIKSVGLAPEIFSMSKSWVYWDLAKQSYMDQHPRESGIGYYLGDPLTNAEVRRDIVDRHFGWDIYAKWKQSSQSKTKIVELLQSVGNSERIRQMLDKEPKSNGTLSSKDLTELGRLLRLGLLA